MPFDLMYFISECFASGYKGVAPMELADPQKERNDAPKENEVIAPTAKRPKSEQSERPKTKSQKQPSSVQNNAVLAHYSPIQGIFQSLSRHFFYFP